LADSAPKAWTQHPALFALAKFAVLSIGLEPWEVDSLTGSNDRLANCGSQAQPTIS
jgi:hypothetical protein